ncbi:hypothetical protein [Micromonospora sp. NPDC005172]|uniref:hypothetical protein n=1 Tax=Micromonospora sp. NPDC005172 TaxID=3156867 RepID=UPI0033A6579C
MNETLVAPLSGYGMLALTLAIAGPVAGLVRAYLAYRTRLHEEREASRRTVARMAGLAGIAQSGGRVVRIVERDRDGQREVDLDGRAEVRRPSDREAA